MSMIESAAGLSDNDFDDQPDYLTKKSLPQVDPSTAVPTAAGDETQIHNTDSFPAPVIQPQATPVLSQPDFGMAEDPVEKAEAKKSDDKVT